MEWGAKARDKNYGKILQEKKGTEKKIQGEKVQRKKVPDKKYGKKVRVKKGQKII